MGLVEFRNLGWKMILIWFEGWLNSCIWWIWFKIGFLLLLIMLWVIIGGKLWCFIVKRCFWRRIWFWVEMSFFLLGIGLFLCYLMDCLKIWWLMFCLMMLVVLCRFLIIVCFFRVFMVREVVCVGIMMNVIIVVLLFEVFIWWFSCVSDLMNMLIFLFWNL